MTQTCDWEQNVLFDIGCTVERIYKFISVAIDKRPERNCLLFHIFFHPLLFAVHKLNQIKEWIKYRKLIDTYVLNRNVPNRHEYKWSRIVMRKCSLNSNALGNWRVTCNWNNLKDWNSCNIPTIQKLIHLPNAVDKLKEYRRSISIRMPIISMANPLGEFVSKAEPFFLYDHLKSPQGPIIRIEQEQCNCRQLGCSIPSVGTVNHHRRPVVFNLINW